MNDDKQTEELVRILQTGIRILSDPEIKISSNLVDDVSNFKGFIRNILNGQLVVVVKEHYDELLAKSQKDNSGDN